MNASGSFLHFLLGLVLLMAAVTASSPAQGPSDVTPIVSSEAAPLAVPDASASASAETGPDPVLNNSFWVTRRKGTHALVLPPHAGVVADPAPAVSAAPPAPPMQAAILMLLKTPELKAPQLKPLLMAAAKPRILPAPAIVVTAVPAAPAIAAAVKAPQPAAIATAAATPAPEADFISTIPVEESLHIIVGRSAFINTRFRLKRVYITNPAVLDSYTATPNQILCTAKETGMSSLILWDDHEMSHTFLVSSDVDVSALAVSLKQALPHEEIHVAAEGGKIVLAGTVSTDAVADSAIKLASQYAKEVSNAMLVNPAKTKQVELKVRIVEVDRSKLDQFGFNFFSSGGSNLAASTTQQFTSQLNTGGSSGGNSSTVGTTTVAVTNPLNFLFYSAKYNVGATLQDLATQNVLQILAEPTITTVSGQKANFLAGGEFPFPVVQGSSTGATSITIQFRSYGVKVEFTPVVNTDGTIALKVAPEVSALDFSNAVSISGYTIPAISTRRAETQVVLNSGESFAISGLLDRRATDAFSKTPGIASVPILGELFKSKNVNHSTSELIVIVTPTTVEPLAGPNSLATPAPAVPMLDPHLFDKKLPKGATKASSGPATADVQDSRP